MFFDHDLTGNDLPKYTLCLTYDDGPGADTLELGRYLHGEGIAATFFVIGRHAETQHDVIAQLFHWRHTVGNHSYSHPGLLGLAEAGGDVVDEIARTDGILRRHLHDSPMFLRPPYGSWRQKRLNSAQEDKKSIVAEILNASGRFSNYLGPVNWDISSADYDFWKRGASAKECAE